eukprot:g22416.t1
MSILDLLQCHNDATRKLEEQHLTFRLGSLKPNGFNVDFTSFNISPPSASSHDPEEEVLAEWYYHWIVNPETQIMFWGPGFEYRHGR